MFEIDENMILNGVSAEVFVGALVKAIEKEKIPEIEPLITLFSTYCFKEEHEKNFPNDIFDTILNFMGRSEFQDLLDSSIVLMIFEQEWGRLTDDQKDRLLDVIKTTFQCFSDEQTFFVLAEILGEYFASDESLNAIIENLQMSNERGRSCLTYGLRKLTKCTLDDKTKEKAFRYLLQLTKDASEHVRYEADLAFA
jgi:hypothetical protein